MPKRWMLPDGISDALPDMAAKIENTRRQVLDLFHSFGYLQIITPHVEFLQSLLVDAQQDLDWYTFKIADPLSGQMLGLRADITPQAARIDAHSLKNPGLNRLCYIGSVIHTKPRGLSATRCPIQVGAELYGSSKLDADIEIICLMLQTLKHLNIVDLHLELAHVGIFQSLISVADLGVDAKQTIFNALQRKDNSELIRLTADLPSDVSYNLRLLPELCGDIGVLDVARRELKNPSIQIKNHLDELSDLASCIKSRYLDLPLHVDLAEVRGFNYYTGLMFAAFVPCLGQALAQGGRYDGIGASFGRARPATGFSADLKALVSLSRLNLNNAETKIWAPFTDDISLWQIICNLRSQGKCVIQADNQQQAQYAGCNSKLVKDNNSWQIQPI